MGWPYAPARASRRSDSNDRLQFWLRPARLARNRGFAGHELGHRRLLRCVAPAAKFAGITLAELVKKNVECLPMREQARLFSESFRASAKAQDERVAAGKETFGGLNEAGGRTMEEALRWGRRIEPEE